MNFFCIFTYTAFINKKCGYVVIERVINSGQSAFLLIPAMIRTFLRCYLLNNVAQHKWSLATHRTISVSAGKYGKRDEINLSSLFKPVSVKNSPDDINIGAELTGTLDKSELVKLLNKFTQKKEIRALCVENGIDREFSCFSRFLTRPDALPPSSVPPAAGLHEL